MEKNIAEKIVENSVFEMTLREDYSGRGMYGSETAGIVTDSIGNVLYSAIKLVKSMIDDPESYDFDVEDLAEAMENIKTDSMGLSMIIY